MMIKVTLTKDQAIDMLKNYLAFVNQVSIDDISVSINDTTISTTKKTSWYLIKTIMKAILIKAKEVEVI